MNIDSIDSNFFSAKALLATKTVDDLRDLASYLPTGTSQLKRKDDFVNALHTSLSSEQLKAHWEKLDDLQQKAVSESVWGNRTFNRETFKAKYGKLPAFKVEQPDRSSYSWPPSRLGLFFIDSQIPVDLISKLREFVSKPEDFKLDLANTLPEYIEVKTESWGAREGH